MSPVGVLLGAPTLSLPVVGPGRTTEGVSHGIPRILYPPRRVHPIDVSGDIRGEVDGDSQSGKS